eukprot:345854-Pyramimonas_sp.AAC.1
MLKFNPHSRISVDKALDVPIFEEVRNPTKETTSASLISLAFDREPDLDEGKLRLGGERGGESEKGRAFSEGSEVP